SPNWFDIAREYTEKWHHTQQVFDAVGRPSTITVRRLFHPCLDALLRGLPFAYRGVSAAPGTVIAVVGSGEGGDTWLLPREPPAWRQVADAAERPHATVSLGQETAWKLFTKRMPRATAVARFPDIEITGDLELGGHVLDMVSVMS